MKYFLSLIFLLIAMIAFSQSDTTNVKPKTKRDYEFRGKPKPKVKPRPKLVRKFGWNAKLINHQDLTKVQKEDSTFLFENQPFIYVDSILYKVDFKDRIYQIADEMPMFPACDFLFYKNPTHQNLKSCCDSLTEYKERKACADKALLDFIYENIKYPTIAREGGVEGTAVVSFVVEKDGTVTNHKVIRNPGGGQGDEALRLTKLLPNFKPGKTDGKPVRIQFNLPIRFRLE